MDWHSLGVKLGLEGHQLRAIEQDHRGNNERLKNEMLDLWLRSAKNPSWEAVVKALHLIKEHRVADEIQRKYCSSSTGNFIAQNVGGLCNHYTFTFWLRVLCSKQGEYISKTFELNIFNSYPTSACAK